ncbi:ABC transporter permease [Dactylosporangium salmoneum]|uniref:ABC transporter permease n=1 Tax=Dactylosporangium salmoneum TaxID=53361 RepID=A0ABP5UYD4_9ACTN
MSADILRTVTAGDVAAPRRRGWRSFLAIPQGGLGVALLLLLLLLVVIGPFVAPDTPNEISDQPILGPSAEHWLGTDAYGRDILSRVLHGGASVILLPLVAVSAAMVVATLVGLVSGYLGGKVDAVVTWVINIALAIPSYLAVLVVVAAFGGGGAVVVTAVAVVYAPYITRVIRSSTQAIAPREFVLAARARGESLGWILFREITPNIGPTLLVEIALRFTYAIMFIASLSFLGLGVQPPSSNWGVMVAQNRTLLLVSPIGVLVPALLIGVLAIAVNLIADALTQFFGDRMHERLMV